MDEGYIDSRNISGLGIYMSRTRRNPRGNPKMISVQSITDIIFDKMESVLNDRKIANETIENIAKEATLDNYLDQFDGNINV